MRDIVSEFGTFISGVLSTNMGSGGSSGTNYGPASTGIAISGYDGLAVYILNPSTSSAGTMAITLQVSDDNGGSANSGHWTDVAITDLVLWTATDATHYTPIKVGNAQPTTLSSTVALNQRLGYVGTTFVSGGVTYNADWARVKSVNTSSWSAPIEVMIVLGRPRLMPSAV
jgi:hypothetical protein